ncbi:MAG TPA: hypothetical protein VIW95_12750 [Candidatus Binatus sp.]|uniref:hypothetical protein n=1 Tax=Candidatus Binatus sp. TaxID=2811406 RepID=UPI002F3F21F6
MARSRLVGTVLAMAFVLVIVAAVLAARQEEPVTTLAKTISDHYLAFTAALGPLGTLSMAIIQTVKDLVPVMRWYQEVKTRHWLRSKAHEAAVAAEASQQFAPREIVKKRLLQPFSLAVLAPELHQAFFPQFDEADEDVAIDAEADLLRLATAGNRPAFYDLPIEQLCGQMNAASQVLLDNPERHEPLLKCLASRAAPQDLKDFASPALRNELATLRNKSQRDSLEEDRFRELQQQLADVRARIANQIHRSIDAFQIATGYRWQWYLRTASFLISFGITAVAVRAGVGSPGDGSPVTNNWALIVAIGLVGGFLAPVTSDLQAIVRQFRTKP